MGRRRTTAAKDAKSQTLPPSPAHSLSSSSSSDFEFTISLSPHKSSSNLCPADELFYKGQILPLHLSPRLSMVRTLLLASSSTSSSDTTTTASRDSTGSSTDSNSSFSSDLVLLPECDSSRPSSVTEEDEFKRINSQIKKPKYFSLSRFSSVFRKESSKNRDQESVKRTSSSAKEMIRKYLKKVKPLYEKLSQKQQQQQQQQQKKTNRTVEISVKERDISSAKGNNGGFSHSFSGNLRYPRRGRCVSSCPSSMRSSPSHPSNRAAVRRGSLINGVSDSSMEELQSAIQGAIAHCKNSNNGTRLP